MLVKPSTHERALSYSLSFLPGLDFFKGIIIILHMAHRGWRGEFLCIWVTFTPQRHHEIATTVVHVSGHLVE